MNEFINENQINEQSQINNNNCCEEQNKAAKCKSFRCIYNIIIVLAIITLFVLHFCHPKSSCKSSTSLLQGGVMKIGYVNSDSITNKYELFKDIAKELETIQNNMQTEYQNAVANYQKEKDSYINKAKNYQLNLEQQKQKERELAEKEMAIMEMQQSLGAKLMEIKTQKNSEVVDTIVSFIKRFNKDKNYTLIFEKSFGNSILYIDPTFDITKEVLVGLNKEYPRIKENREKK